MKTEDVHFGRGAPAAPRPRVLYSHHSLRKPARRHRGLLVALAPAVFFVASGLMIGAVGSPAVAAVPRPPIIRHVLDPSLALRRYVPAAIFQPSRAGFSLRADGRPLLFQVQAIPALPGQTIEVRPGLSESGEGFTLRVREGEVIDREVGWSWTAPTAPGAYPLEIVHHGTSESIAVTVLVAHPAEVVKDGRILGYRLGLYKEIPLRGDPAYLPPAGFIEVPRELLDLAVSPHFALGQFPCKQEGGRRFLLLSPELVTKLEAGLEALNRAGHSVPTLHVMSGYRTPAYNRAIGNTSVYSRHLYGDAADIFVDVDGDGYMDDLNGDGRRDTSDARLLMGHFDRLARDHDTGIKPGGLGLYGPKPHRGPFVHVDTRGTRARW
jgi:hypothetical protein